MEGFRFIPNDVIYVESACASESIIDIDFYRNIFERNNKRLVYLPEMVRYAIPNVEFDKQTLYDAIIKQSGLDITGWGFIIVAEDGSLSYVSDNDSLGVLLGRIISLRTEELSLDGEECTGAPSDNIIKPKFTSCKMSKSVSLGENRGRFSLFDSGEEENSFESPQLRITQSKVPLGCGFIVSSESYEEIEELRGQVREAVDRLLQLGVDYKAILDLIKSEPKLSRMVVTDMGRIILPDYNEMEIEMRPTAKALYLLYLKYEDGIAFKDLPDYKDELMKIYAKVSNLSSGDAQREAVEALVDPFQNTINVACSRVKEAFVSKFNKDLADYYVISGKRGEPKKIKLNRGLVDLRCTW